MLFFRENYLDEVFRSRRDLSNDSYYYDFDICSETGQDYMVAVLGIPCIVVGFLITVVFFVSSSLHGFLLKNTDTFIHSFLLANCLNFLTKTSSVIEFMVNECWHAGVFACKLSIWSSEFTSTAAVSFLVLAVVDAYHPRIHRFLLLTKRRCIAVGAVVLWSVMITIPNFLLVGLKEFGGNTLCTFTSDTPNHYTLLMKKDLLVEYVIPILLTTCIVIHGYWTSSRDVINATAEPRTFASDGVVSLQTFPGASQETNPRGDRRSAMGTKNRHAMILAMAFLVLKLPHNYAILVYVYDVPPRSLKLQAMMDYFELAACLTYAGCGPLLVLIGSKTHRKNFKETLHIFKSFMSGRPWQPGFEMDLRSEPQSKSPPSTRPGVTHDGCPI